MSESKMKTKEKEKKKKKENERENLVRHLLIIFFLCLTTACAML